MTGIATKLKNTCTYVLKFTCLTLNSSTGNLLNMQARYIYY